MKLREVHRAKVQDPAQTFKRLMMLLTQLAPGKFSETTTQPLSGVTLLRHYMSNDKDRSVDVTWNQLLNQATIHGTDDPVLKLYNVVDEAGMGPRWETPRRRNATGYDAFWIPLD